MRFTIKSKFGTAELQAVSSLECVRDMHSCDTPASALFDTETAEKLALIGESSRIQLVSPPLGRLKEPRWWIIYHVSGSQGYRCQVASLNYNGGIPQDEIRDAVRPCLYGLPAY